MRNQQNHRRNGAALVLICVLLGIVFIAVAFSVDIARLQMTQLELQSTADLAARAGAEAMSRGVADPSNNAMMDTAIRNEMEMIAELNRAGGLSIDLNEQTEITFGSAVSGAGGAPEFQATADGTVDSQTDAVRVTPGLPNFPFMFGAFVGSQDIDLQQSAAAMVQERDIVAVLDRSTSMLKLDAGAYNQASYNANLRQVQEDLYLEGDRYHPDTSGGSASSTRHTEFAEDAGTLTLSRTQALKLAVLRFRQEVNDSRGQEQLGLVTYSSAADLPYQASTAPGPVDIEAGLSSSMHDLIVGNGITQETEKYASALEDGTYGYQNFDFNYIGMRWRPGTNIADGIDKGVQTLFGTGRRPFATPILIVMTDGQHNQSGTPEASATAAMTNHPNLRIYTITFGSGADIARMQTVASIGRGAHYHASDVNALVAAFVDLARTAGVTLIE